MVLYSSRRLGCSLITGFTEQHVDIHSMEDTPTLSFIVVFILPQMGYAVSRPGIPFTLGCFIIIRLLLLLLNTA